MLRQFIGVPCVSALLVAALPASTLAQTKTVVLGQCPLELGGRIENCRVGYRAFGTLNAQKTNAILIPTWFASPADSWAPLLGPAGVVDTTGFYVVVTESLGAASSSSPSNSGSQSGARFPDITVGDMVEASYRLAHDHLGLPGLYAVVGISLGGLQAFEWGVKHPDYARRIVPIVGAPYQGSYGRAMWELLMRTLEDGIAGAVPPDSTAISIARFLQLAGTSPAGVTQQSATDYARSMREQAQQMKSFNLPEWRTHARAILRHDIARNFGGDLAAAARAWKAKTLVVAATHDHSVDAAPARAFARLIHADTLFPDSPAGHSVIFSDTSVMTAVRTWLKR